MKEDTLKAKIRDLQAEIEGFLGSKTTIYSDIDNAISSEDFEAAARLKLELKALDAKNVKAAAQLNMMIFEANTVYPQKLQKKH